MLIYCVKLDHALYSINYGNIIAAQYNIIQTRSIGQEEVSISHRHL